MNRREFIKTAALGAAALGAAGRLGFADETVTPAGASPSGTGALKGFVVADAHFGWEHHEQPSLDAQAAAMRHIMTRFPDLDLFLDAGDSLHGGGADHAANWMKVLQCGSGTVPYFLCPGNHELLGWPAPDAETLCCELGSMPCKPYYSFDIKGIHFVVVPQLLFCSLMTDDTLKWLELDLDVNKESTTILLAHNSIAGTTLPQDNIGYRRLADSRRVRAFLKRYPNVVAWLHGHNHTWEMVRKDGKLFVSCGRIGGYNPPYPGGHFGKDNLGGFYFEVGPDRLTVKGYSVTHEKFFDEMEDYKHLTQTLKIRTTLNPKAPCAYSYGIGGSRDGERIPVYNHNYLNGGSQELYISGVDSPVFNENSDTSIYTQMTHSASQRKILPGYSITERDVNAVGEDFSWDWLNPGVLLYPVEGKPDTIISLPEGGRSSKGYYRIAPGRKYRVAVHFETAQPGPTVQVTMVVRDRAGEQVHAIEGPEWKLGAGRRTFEAVFAVPDLKGLKSIYADPSSDNRFHVTCDLAIKGQTHDIIFHGARLSFAGASDKTFDPAVTFDGTKLAARGELAPGSIARFDLSGGVARRSVVEIAAGGNRRLTWLVRQTGPIWTIRNACIVDKGGYFEIDGLRNTWTPNEEAVVTPLARVSQPYLYKTRHITKAKVHPFAQGEMSIEITESTAPAEIEVRCDARPKTITGADSWDHANGIALIKKTGAGEIKIGF
ncbi:MAG: metallophosphoesterase [Armatimonadota bacterium]|nr:metallophosphoesterase [Armatimonadota bacterium]